MKIENDPPVQPEEGAVVIDLAGRRIARGFTRGRGCRHRHLTYDQRERRIWCQDCNRTVEPFDAFMVVAEGFDDMVRDARRLKREAEDALAKTIHLRAAQAIEKLWRGRKHDPCCPACGSALTPEAMLKAPIKRRE